MTVPFNDKLLADFKNIRTNLIFSVPLLYVQILKDSIDSHISSKQEVPKRKAGRGGVRNLGKSGNFFAKLH